MMNAGEIADGAVLNYLVARLTSVPWRRWPRAAKAGRGIDDIDRPVVVCSVHEDRELRSTWQHDGLVPRPAIRVMRLGVPKPARQSWRGAHLACTHEQVRPQQAGTR